MKYGSPFQVIKALIDGGANVDHVGSDGNMAIHVCCTKESGIELEWLIYSSELSYSEDLTIDKDLEILDELIKVTSSLSVQNHSGDCPLEILAKSLEHKGRYTPILGLSPNEKIEKAIEKLLDQGVDSNVKGRGKNSPLTYAIRSEIPSLVQAFIDSGADVLLDGENQESALDLSLKSDKQIRDIVVQSVVHKGFVPKLKSKTKKINFIQILLDDGYEDSFIHEAITLGLDPNDVVPGTDSPLIAAVKAERCQIVLHLLDAGANVYYKNRERMSAFDIFADICLKQKMNIGEENNRSLIDEQKESSCEELEKCKRQVLKSFLSHGIQVNRSTKSGAFPLHIAASLHDEDAVKLIVKNGGHVDAVNKDFETPLMIAALDGSTKVVRLLLSEKANPNLNHSSNLKGYIKGYTVSGNILTRMLQTSSCSEDTLLDITNILLQHGCDPNLELSGTDSPLMCAVRLNLPELTRTLLEAKAEVNHTGKDNLTALHVYFERTSQVPPRFLEKRKCEGQNDILKMLLQFGASTEILSIQNELALHLALSSDSQHSETEIIYLLNHSGDCNIKSKSGSYPLLLATDKGYFQVAKKLILMGVDVKCQDQQKQTVLHYCMCNEALDKELILQCTAKGANINAFNVDGYTPLAVYIMYSWEFRMSNMNATNSVTSRTVDDIRFLLEKGADPDVCTTDGNSALVIAVNLKIPDIIFQLIDAKANVNFINKNGTTALHVCLKNGDNFQRLMATENIEMGRQEESDIYKDIIKSLVEAGADVNIVDDMGQSPIYTLISKNDEERCDQLLPILLTKDANVNCGDEVPLILAAKKFNYKAIDTLLKKGADIDRIDKHGDTALTAVLCQNKKGIERSLFMNPLTFGLNTPWSLTHTLEYERFLRQDGSVGKTVDVLLKAGAEPNPYKSDTDRNSPLIEAIQMQFPSVVKNLLMFGADPNYIGKNNLTVLQNFILEKDCSTVYHEILNALVDYKVDINLTDTHDFPVLMAIKMGQVETVRTLLTAFPDAADTGEYTQEALQSCLTLDLSEGIAMIDMLLEVWSHKENMIQETFVNDYLIWLISKTQYITEKVSVKLLSDLTIEITNVKKNEDSPLIYFTHYGSAEIVGLLLERNQDVNHVGRMGRTALHHIIERLCHDEAKDIFDLIWAHKPTLLIKDEMGKTPIDLIFKGYGGYHKTDLSEILLSFIARDGLPCEKIITETFQRSSENGDFKVMSALLPHVPDVNQACNYTGDTVLHTCWSDREAVQVNEVIQFVTLFKKAGGSLTTKNEFGIQPLISLLKSEIQDENIVKIVQCFVSEGALETSEKYERFPLHVAIARGQLLTVGFLLRSGQCPMIRNSYNESSLHVAVTYQNANCVQIVEQLIEHCDQAKLSEVFGDDILALAINNADTWEIEETTNLTSNLVSLLLEKGADPNRHNSTNIPLHRAARYCDVSTMESLVVRGSNINVKNDRGQNALHNIFVTTTQRGNKNLAVSYLLHNGIDVNLQDAAGVTPLMMAVNANETDDVVKILLNNQANVHLLSNGHESVLDMFCATGKHLGIGKLLVNAGASPKNCLALAISNCRLNQLEDFELFLLMLLDKGADPNTSTYSAEPCLITAIEMCMTNVVRRMCQCGVDVNAKYGSQSALHYACELEKDRKRDELVKILLDHGASLTSDKMCALDAYAKSMIKDLSFFDEGGLTSEKTNMVISIDLSLFNIMVQGGKDLNSVTSTCTSTYNPYSHSSTDTTLEILIQSGFFMAAENLLKCGLNLKNEKWLKIFDLDAFDLSNIRIKSRWLERQDVDERKIKLSEALTGWSVKCNSIQSLSCHCRFVIRNVIRTACSGAEILSKIDELPVPKQIKTYLSFSDNLHASEIIVAKRPSRFVSN